MVKNVHTILLLFRLMEKQFWVTSWELEGHHTSFHRKDVHPYVTRHLPPAALQDKCVFVPLCGKTLDLLYFRQYAHHVVGVELVEKAVLQFFEENQLAYRRDGSRFISDKLTILCQDFFALTRQDVGPVDLVYDRAALVALPPTLRQAYLRQLETLVPVGAEYFLNTLEYAPELPSPPFSITPAEVAAYFPNYHIDHVEQPQVPTHGMVRKYNLTFLIEHGFLMRKQAPNSDAALARLDVEAGQSIPASLSH